MKHKYSPNIGGRGVPTLPGPRKYKKLIRYKRISTFLLIFQVVSIMFSLFVSFTVMQKTHNSVINYYDETKISFTDLNETDIESAQFLLDNIPDYVMSPVYEIVFTRDDFYCEKYEYNMSQHKLFKTKQANIVEDTVIGLNNNDYIIVEWTDDVALNAQTLCHEILHSYFRYPKGGVFEDDSHAAMDLVADNLGCYDFSFSGTDK